MPSRWESEFDRAMQECGGRLDVEKIQAPWRGVFEGLRADVESYLSKFRDHEEPSIQQIPNEIHFDFVDAPSVNAVAFRVCDTYFIGMFTGTVLFLFDFALKIMSDARVLPEIGNLSLERRDRLEFGDALSLVADRSSCAPQGALFKRLPRDRMRFRFAMWLAHCAVTYIVLHELAHIVFGHVDYLCKKTGISTMQEFGAAYQSQLPSVALRALEIDADCSAASVFFDCVYRALMGTGDHAEEMLKPQPRTANPFTFAGMAVGFIFHLFDHVGLAIDGYEHSTHPHPAIRNYWAFGDAHDFHDRYRPALRDEFVPAYRRAMDECAALWQLLGLPQSVWDTGEDFDRVVADIGRQLERLRAEVPPLI